MSPSHESSHNLVPFESKIKWNEKNDSRNETDATIEKWYEWIEEMGEKESEIVQRVNNESDEMGKIKLRFVEHTRWKRYVDVDAYKGFTVVQMKVTMLFGSRLKLPCENMFECISNQFKQFP